eukprot:131904-Chlamydomonas_euryale.AAC.1
MLSTPSAVRARAAASRAMTPPRPPRSCSLPAALPLLLAALLAAACGAHGSGPDSGAGGDRGFTHGVASFDPTQ